MLPTTLNCTSECFLSYSATTLLNARSSRACQPTHTVSLSTFFAAGAAVAAPRELIATTAAIATAASTTPTVARFMRFLLFWPVLVNDLYKKPECKCVQQRASTC